MAAVVRVKSERESLRYTDETSGAELPLKGGWRIAALGKWSSKLIAVVVSIPEQQLPFYIQHPVSRNIPRERILYRTMASKQQTRTQQNNLSTFPPPSPPRPPTNIPLSLEFPYNVREKS